MTAGVECEWACEGDCEAGALLRALKRWPIMAAVSVVHGCVWAGRGAGEGVDEGTGACGVAEWEKPHGNRP